MSQENSEAMHNDEYEYYDEEEADKSTNVNESSYPQNHSLMSHPKINTSLSKASNLADRFRGS